MTSAQVCGDDQLAERAAHAQCRLGRFKVWSTHGKEPAPRKRGPHVWRGIPEDWQNNALEEKWENLFKIKQEANVAIEAKRVSKEIGSSLEAHVSIKASGSNFNFLKDIDLAEYLITSKADLLKNTEKGIDISVKKASGKKCPRCWKILVEKCLRCENAS